MAETKIQHTRIEIEPVTPPEGNEGLPDWIEKQLTDGREFLLAHFDDGVMWGKLGADDKLITSHDLAPELSPQVRLVTLQQAFIFGEQSEVRLWPGEVGGWEARLIRESKDQQFNGAEAQERDCFDEDQILWGTEVKEPFPEDFTHVLEKRQHGMEHVVPVKVDNAQLNARNLKLRVRHFINYDEHTGEARIYLSRLVKVFVS